MAIEADGEHGDLDLLFVSPEVHSKGIGYAAWCAVERLHPEVAVRETVKHFLLCQSLRFPHRGVLQQSPSDPNDPDRTEEKEKPFPDGMFRFEKGISCV